MIEGAGAWAPSVTISVCIPLSTFSRFADTSAPPVLLGAAQLQFRVTLVSASSTLWQTSFVPSFCISAFALDFRVTPWLTALSVRPVSIQSTAFHSLCRFSGRGSSSGHSGACKRTVSRL
jgi:hypothetical protein